MIDATRAILLLSTASIKRLLVNPERAFRDEDDVLSNEINPNGTGNHMDRCSFAQYICCDAFIPRWRWGSISDPDKAIGAFFGGRAPSDLELMDLREAYGIERHPEREGDYEITLKRTTIQTIQVRVQARSRSEAIGLCMAKPGLKERFLAEATEKRGDPYTFSAEGPVAATPSSRPRSRG